jgi:hypothetical protein
VTGSAIAPIADRLEAASHDRDRIRGLLYDYARKGDVGRARALAKLRKHLDLANITFSRQGIMWSWLAPLGCMLIDPKNEGEAQDAILVRYGFAWIERRRELNGYEAFSLELPDHATSRLVQRAFDVNLPRVLMEAQDQFFAADVATVSRHVAHGTSLYLRACPGLLICEAINGRTPSGMNYWFARARTWISDSMVRPDHVSIAAAFGLCARCWQGTDSMNAPLIIAHHEAGHAVVGMALGIGITKLESWLCHFRPCNGRMAWWAYAVMALGGPAAEQRYACYPFDFVAMKRNSVWAADYRRAYDWLRRSGAPLP